MAGHYKRAGNSTFCFSLLLDSVPLWQIPRSTAKESTGCTATDLCGGSGSPRFSRQ